MDPPKFLVLGAAGYIGGTVLTDLLKQYTASSITVLVRKPEQEQLFTTLGVNVVSGDVADAAKLKSLASEHDLVLNFAVAFGGDETSIQALVDGLEERARKTQSKPVLLHTGGSGTVMYGSGGEAGADVWTDEQYDRWSSLPDTAFFYGGYRIVAAAALRGTISAYIVLSPTVYGRGTGPGNNLSQLTVAVAEFALRNPDKTTASASSKGWENLIYSGVDTHTWGPITRVLGDLLFARGETSKPSAIEIAEGEGILYMFGGNSFLAPSKKAKALGFRPKQKDLVNSMRDALPAWAYSTGRPRF
ncbi:unnamed protein product [Alternaria alternata]